MAIRRKKKAVPYWLTAHHEEHCTGCEHPHAVAVTVRCAGCDRGHCPFCVTFVEGEAFCKECDPEGGAKPWRRARSGKA